MNRELKKIISDDIFRYFGKKKLSLLESLLLSRREVALYCSMIHRKAHFYSNSSKKISALFYRFKLNHVSRKHFFQIPYTVKIGRGFCIVHFGRIIIAPQVTIGNNCNIFTGVTIGSTARGIRAGVPKVGNDVWIGPNAVLVGKIVIGNDVLIAANAYVNFDVPDHSIVLGNPGKIISKEYATDGYICRKV